MENMDPKTESPEKLLKTVERQLSTLDLKTQMWFEKINDSTVNDSESTKNEILSGLRASNDWLCTAINEGKLENEITEHHLERISRCCRQIRAIAAMVKNLWHKDRSPEYIYEELSKDTKYVVIRSHELVRDKSENEVEIFKRQIKAVKQLEQVKASDIFEFGIKAVTKASENLALPAAKTQETRAPRPFLRGPLGPQFGNDLLQVPVEKENVFGSGIDNRKGSSTIREFCGTHWCAE